MGLPVTSVAVTTDEQAVFIGNAVGYFDLGHQEAVVVPGRANTVLGRLDADGTLISLRSFESPSRGSLTVDSAGNAIITQGASDRAFVDLLEPEIYGARTEMPYFTRFDQRGHLISVHRNEDGVGAPAIRNDSAFSPYP